MKPGLWNNIHATVDYGDSEGFVEGSEFMPEGYPFTAALKVLCEGGVVEFMFRAGGVSVEMGGANSLVVYEPGKSYALDATPGDAYENQASYFVDCVRNGRMPIAGTRGAGEARRPVRRSSAPVARDPAQWLRFSLAPDSCARGGILRRL